nr:uncharacterized protein LOC100187530 [Ciona intestinalis]|eukprot:XP_002123580.1 uncharacterized protein LOC100187530 [Ciona intestinalis]
MTTYSTEATSSWTTQHNNSSAKCEPPNIVQFYAEGIPAYVFLPFHVFLVISLTVFRRNLHRRVVNLYILNVVAANTLSCLWRCVQYSVDLQLWKYKHEELISWGSGLNLWWLISISMSMTLLLGSTGSIMLAIMAMRNSVFHVHRTVAGFSVYQQPEEDIPAAVVQHRTKFKAWRSKNPSKFALGLISVNWLVAILFLIVSLSLQDCLATCECLFGFVSRSEMNVCKSPKATCLNKDPPMHANAVILSIVIWFLSVTSLVVILVRFGIDYKNFKFKVVESLRVKNNSVETASRNISSREDDLVVQNSAGRSLPTPERRFRAPTSMLLRSLRRKILSLVFVSVIFGAGTGYREIRDLISFFQSILMKDTGTQHVLNPFSSAIEIISSVVLCWVARGTQTALRSAFRAIIHALNCRPT